MLLAIDVGNTNIMLGIYRGKELVSNWRVQADSVKTCDEYGAIFANLFVLGGLTFKSVEHAILSSVVPPITNVIHQFIEKYINISPIIVGAGVKTGISIHYDNPREVGADRIVNAVAAIEKYGTPLIIIDFGTATTFDAISENGDYLGGAIAPGIGISLDALFLRASKLPRVELEMPLSVIGKDTVSSIQAGTVFGYAGLIDGIVGRMKEELGKNTKVVSTGGYSSLLKPASRHLNKVDEMLTLTGLRIIFERNPELTSGANSPSKGLV